MRKKLILLLLTLAAVAGSEAGLFAPRAAEAAPNCNGILVCCPDSNRCVCCIRPCPIQCP
jgi:hypothetical protein